MKKNLSLWAVSAAGVLLLFAPTHAQIVQPPYWGSTGTPCVANTPNVDRTFTTHPELAARLEQIALTSGGAFYGAEAATHNQPPGHGGTPPGVSGTPPGLSGTPPASGNADPIARRVVVDVPGYSVRGREVYRARVGGGNRVALLIGNIHGNEKHGMEALQNLLEWLGTSESEEARQIRRELTVVAVPMLNPDGSTRDRRHNDQPWSLVQTMYPQLLGASPVWYYSSSQGGGLDLNRDHNADFLYEPTIATLPPMDGFPGSYLGTESRTMRAIYSELRAEFGHVDLVVDLHNQETCARDRSNGNAVSFLSIAGWLGPTYPGSIPPGVNDTLTKQANVAVYDALQIPGTEWRFVTRFQASLGRPGAMLGAYAVYGSATVLMETSGQTGGLGTRFKEFLVLGNEIALKGALGAFADLSVYSLDPGRYDSIQLK